MGRDAVHRDPVQPGRTATAGIAALALLALLRAPVVAHDPVTTAVTFEREVRAILQAHCASCHSAGGPSPMPLTTYEQVRPWARAIKTQVLTRRMPMWSAAHGYGTFANDPSLSSAELAVLAAWVDGGQPKGVAATAGPHARADASASLRARMPRFVVPAGAVEASVRTAARWIAGWDFEPGDPLITSATFTSADGAPIATWVAGDAPVELPAGSAIRVTSPIHVQFHRRTPADYEEPARSDRSTVRLLPLAAAPSRRVWIERTTCGTPLTGGAAGLMAVRPLLGDRDSARLWLERPGAPPVILGWFRDSDARYPRTFWLARPAELTPESRVASENGCIVELALITAPR